MAVWGSRKGPLDRPPVRFYKIIYRKIESVAKLRTTRNYKTQKFLRPNKLLQTTLRVNKLRVKKEEFYRDRLLTKTASRLAPMRIMRTMTLRKRRW